MSVTFFLLWNMKYSSLWSQRLWFIWQETTNSKGQVAHIWTIVGRWSRNSDRAYYSVNNSVHDGLYRRLQLSLPTQFRLPLFSWLRPAIINYYPIKTKLSRLRKYVVDRNYFTFSFWTGSYRLPFKSIEGGLQDKNEPFCLSLNRAVKSGFLIISSLRSSIEASRQKLACLHDELHPDKAMRSYHSRRLKLRPHTHTDTNLSIFHTGTSFSSWILLMFRPFPMLKNRHFHCKCTPNVHAASSMTCC